MGWVNLSWAPRLQIFVKLSFRELYNSKLSGLHPFDNMAIIHENRLKELKYIKNGKVGCEIMRHQALE